jgi:hypothetical protein
VSLVIPLCVPDMHSPAPLLRCPPVPLLPHCVLRLALRLVCHRSRHRLCSCTLACPCALAPRRSRFPNCAGWAHSLLFMAELPQYVGLLPQAVQQEMAAFKRQEKELKVNTPCCVRGGRGGSGEAGRASCSHAPLLAPRSALRATQRCATQRCAMRRQRQQEGACARASLIARRILHTRTAHSAHSLARPCRLNYDSQL